VAALVRDLEEIEEELATLRRLAERGRAGSVAPRVADLLAERARLTAPRPTGVVDPGALRPVIEARVL
jgi:hypothetical protein